MVPFPSKLPRPRQDGFSAKLANVQQFLRMDDGGRRPIARWNVQPIEYSLSFQFDWDQMAIFEGWWKYDLQAGAELFQLEVLPGLVETLRVVSSDYTAEYSEYWTVSFKVQAKWPAPSIRPQSVLPRWTLPEIEKSGYKLQQFGAAATLIESGERDARKRFDSNHADVVGSVVLDLDQLLQFFAFVRDDLIGGMGWFEMPIAAGVGSKIVRTSLIDFEVASIGSAFKVGLELTTFKAPKLSYLQYRYPDGLKFFDELLLTEHFGNRDFNGSSEGLEINESATMRFEGYASSYFSEDYTDYYFILKG